MYLPDTPRVSLRYGCSTSIDIPFALLQVFRGILQEMAVITATKHNGEAADTQDSVVLHLDAADLVRLRPGGELDDDLMHAALNYLSTASLSGFDTLPLRQSLPQLRFTLRPHAALLTPLIHYYCVR
jgi:hypothetical protein